MAEQKDLTSPSFMETPKLQPTAEEPSTKYSEGNKDSTLGGCNKLSCTLGPREKQTLQKNLGQRISWEKGGFYGSPWGRILEEETLGIIMSVNSSGGSHFGKIWSHPSGLRSPRPNNQQSENTAPPICKQAVSDHSQRQSPTHQRDNNQLHLPVGKHQSLPSGSLQQALVPTLPTRWQAPEARDVTTLQPEKRRPTQKSIQNEKAEKYDTGDGTRKKLRKMAKCFEDQPP